MPMREWVEETRPMYEYGAQLFAAGLSMRDRDIAVKSRFGNEPAYLDAACEGYYDAMDTANEGKPDDPTDDDDGTTSTRRLPTMPDLTSPPSVVDLEREVERLRTVIEDALQVATMEGRDFNMEPWWASLDRAVNPA
jgi:hypothetical protein